MMLFFKTSCTKFVIYHKCIFQDSQGLSSYVNKSSKEQEKIKYIARANATNTGRYITSEFTHHIS